MIGFQKKLYWITCLAVLGFGAVGPAFRDDQFSKAAGVISVAVLLGVIAVLLRKLGWFGSSEVERR